MIGFVRKVNNIKYKPRTIHFRDYRYFDSDKHLKNQNWTKLYQCNNVNDAMCFMKDILLTAFNNFCPFVAKKIKGKPSPWLTADIKKLMNDRDKPLRKYRRVKSRALKERFKLKRNLVNAVVRTAKSNYTKSLLEENANNASSFWKTLKRIFPTKNKNCHVENSFTLTVKRKQTLVKSLKSFVSTSPLLSKY